MKSLDTISEDLFNKIRGRFPSVTIGTQEGKVTNDPKQARYFDFDYKSDGKNIGKISVSVSEDSVSVMYTNSFMEDQDEVTRENWYNFLKELRSFAKKRLLNFDTRDITKSNLDRRDYKFLAQNSGEMQMSESKLYGTSQVSYQRIGEARLNIRHRSAVNPEQPASRTRNIDRIYIESPEGERFRYPYRHLAGARAMARHVSEGGNPYDDFGKHVVGLSEELNNLKKFKTYVGRSRVMAEGLSQYMDIIEGRAKEVKKQLESIQKSNGYANIIENYESVVLEDVPEDVKTNWVDELTIRQFNEDLKDVFPYIYRLIGEGTKTKEIGPEEIAEESKDDLEYAKKYLRFLYRTDASSKDIADQKKKIADLEKNAGKDTAQDESEQEQETTEEQLPITEFILSNYDRETGAWPRGETAVLTSIEKDYGENFIEPAKQFIEKINQTFEQYSEGCGCEEEPQDQEEDEAVIRLRNLAGL